MATAATVRDLLGERGVEYEEVVHPRAVTASRVAEAAHVPGDDAVADQPEVYFEAGDHETLVQVRGETFAQLMDRAVHGGFSSDI